MEKAQGDRRPFYGEEKNWEDALETVCSSYTLYQYPSVNKHLSLFVSRSGAVEGGFRTMGWGLGLQIR